MGPDPSNLGLPLNVTIAMNVLIVGGMLIEKGVDTFPTVKTHPRHLRVVVADFDATP
jgi:hypothetical protein